MEHAFLSYIRTDTDIIKYVASILRANGIDYWMDVEDLSPGTPWRDQLRNAIQGGAFFLPFFSAAWLARESTVANEELVWAIEELRRRPTNRAWFIPILLEGGAIPDREIGAGLRLSDLQRISVGDHGWQVALTQLLSALGVNNAILDAGEPLASGLPSVVKITDGWFSFDSTEPDLPQVNNLEFQVSGGTTSRGSDGLIVAEIQSRAPNTQLQQINELLGLDEIICNCVDTTISCNPEFPSKFCSSRTHVMKRGTIIPPMFGNPSTTLPIDLQTLVNWTAVGSVSGDRFSGKYEATMRYSPVNLMIAITGRFSLGFARKFGV